MNFDDLYDKVKGGLNNQSNYQFGVICHLAKCDKHADIKQNIAQTLAELNGQTKHNKFMSVPVWEVLTKKGIISIDKSTKMVKLLIRMDDQQSKRLSRLCGKNF